MKSCCVNVAVAANVWHAMVIGQYEKHIWLRRVSHEECVGRARKANADHAAEPSEIERKEFCMHSGFPKCVEYVHGVVPPCIA